MKKLFALRGACCAENTQDDIKANVTEVFDALLIENGICEEDVVSLVFSVTADLDAQNPAQALREGGRAGSLALFSVAESATQGGLPRVVRFLMHCYMEETAMPQHVYTKGAEKLRPDRATRKKIE
jgi:chorismate mutase